MFGKSKPLAIDVSGVIPSCLAVLAPILTRLHSVVLSSNDFSANSAVKLVCSNIRQAGNIALKHLDLRYTRISKDMKIELQDVCRNNKIDLKVW